MLRRSKSGQTRRNLNRVRQNSGVTAGTMRMNERARVWAALGLAAILTLAFWFAMDRSVPAPDWQGRTMGVSYNPSGLFTSAQAQDVSPAQIAHDMAQLSKITDRVRTYSVSRGLDAVPAMAAIYGMKVSLGIWLSPNRAANEDEITRALQTIRENPRTIDRIFVGNEAILRGDLPAAEVAAYMRKVKRGLPRRIPVSTAEPWHVWRDRRELAEPADFIGAHFLPFWEGTPAERAMKNVTQAFYELAIVFWDKPIVIGEVGWPSEGRTFRNAVASTANQAAFTRDFLAASGPQGWDYYLIEAYDQPWKVKLEGAVGAYWGIFDAYGAPKFAFAGPVSMLPDWPLLALIAVVLTLAAGAWILRRTDVSLGGKLFLSLILSAIMSGVLAIYYNAALTYADLRTWIVYLMVAPLGLLAASVILTEGVEFAHAVWRTKRRAKQPAVSEFHPMVSIHVPAYNEPPDMMIDTLNALARLDYPHFEVIVLDNNTRDPAVWRPVQDHCAKLGPKFRFFHFDGVKGFKSGALNLAMKLTDKSADIVAVIDSDYQVAHDWLRNAVPHFADPQVAIVQAPQDYRDAHETSFKAMAYQEYAGFFRIGMVERDEDNAIIQHGTMTMMRRVALDRAGWAEWCITEDTELGLRLFQEGWKAVYIDRSFGRGVMPDTFADFKAQRYRWVYGAMQIAKKHWRAFGLSAETLTSAQKYHFIAGWLPWVSDALSLVFVGAALLWTALMVIDPIYFDAPLASLGYVALSLFAFKVAKTLTLYPLRVRSGLTGALMAAVAGLALSHTVARAVIAGLTTKNLPFIRTPKLAGQARLGQAFAMARQETCLLVALVLAMTGTYWVRGPDDPAGLVWMVMLGVQAIPYFAATIVSAISVWPTGQAASAVAQPAGKPSEGVTVVEAAA